MEKNLKKLDIKDGDELIVYDNEAFCTLYSLVPEDEDARYEDDYLIRDCKRNNTVRFNRLGRKGA